jgi:hypothetical protein
MATGQPISNRSRRPRWTGGRGIALALMLGVAGCDSTQTVLDPDALQPGARVTSIALADAIDRVVPAIPDANVSRAVGDALRPLQLHLANGDIVQARTTLWHVTHILDSYHSYPDAAVGAELSAVRLAIGVVYDYLKIPFGG